MPESALRCSHPLFKYSSKARWQTLAPEIKNPHVFVFEREEWIAPTEAQIAEYRRNQETVEKLGGVMKRLEYEIAGRAPRLTEEDTREMVAAVVRDNPEVKVVQCWNGKGFYGFSVGVEVPA